MEVLQYVALGFAPGVFWLWFLRHKDDLDPEPKRMVLWVFALGCASTIPVIFARPPLEDLLPLDGNARHLADAFLLTAPLEEAVKLLAFAVGAYWHRAFDEPLDGVIYGTAAGLGFASVENVLYLLQTENAMVVVLRAFTATPLHVATAGSIGFFAGVAKFAPAARRPWLWLTGFVIAVAVHGAYDYFLFRNDGNSWISLLCVLPFALVLLALKLRWARARSEEFHG